MRIAGMNVKRGSLSRGAIETEGYVDGARVRVPVIVAVGSQPGKTLAVVAAQHGRELNGPASVYAVLKRLRPKEMAGSIILFPIANPLCVRMQVQDFPTDNNRYMKAGPEHLPMNLNRQWPGDADGSLPQRIAYAIWNAGVKDADCVLDLHCWTDSTTALAWGTRSARPFVHAFGFPWFEIRAQRGVTPGMLEWACMQGGIPCVACELTPQNVVNPAMVAHGARGILNLAKELGVVAGQPEHPHVRYELAAGGRTEVVSEKAGLLVPQCRPGVVVPKGQLVAELVDLDTLRSVQRIAPPARMVLWSIGCTWGTGQLGYHVVRAGETVARFAAIQRQLPPTVTDSEGYPSGRMRVAAWGRDGVG